MRTLARLLAISAMVAVGATAAQAGAATIPSNLPALEKRLATYDPKAVAAARHYFNMPAIKDGMVAMIDNLETAMGQTVAKQNPSLSPIKIAQLQKIAGDALKERLDLLMQMNMVNALDVMTTDELEAIDRFYSTPEGGRILAKMPRLTAALPAIVQAIMPDYLADVQRRVKQAGAELKL